MTIAFDCPECMSPLQLADNLAGQRRNCPVCGTTFVVPRGLAGAGSSPSAVSSKPPPGLRPSAVPPPRPTRPAGRAAVPVARPAPGAVPPPRPAQPVRSDQGRPRPTPPPVTREYPPIEDYSPDGGGVSLLPVVPVLFLLLGLSAVVGRDFFLVKAEAPAATGAAAEDNRVLIDPNPRLELQFHDREVEVQLGKGGVKPGNSEASVTENAIWEPSMRFGLQTLGGRNPGKKLTFDEQGETNNAVVKLDGHEYLFGDRPFLRKSDRKEIGRTWPGHWEEGHVDDTDLGKDATGRKRDGARSVWVYDDQQVYVTQTVEIVPGEQSRLLDTCLIRYKLENRDSKPHQVGLRFLLDTYIGGNDGVPFLIPGEKQLCDTQHDFVSPEEVPDFIQALERENLRNPGTICQVRLKLGGKIDPPDRVTLGCWPNPKLHDRDPRCLQEKTLWTVPVFDIKTLNPPDSAVTIYWNPRELAPGASREIGFAYGLGNVSSEGGKLGLTVGGSFVPNGEFTLTAYVSNPQPDQTVTLTLPEGFRLIEGDLKRDVPPLPEGAASKNSPVTWRIRAGSREGQFTLKVQSSTGVSQTQDVRIRGNRLFD